MTLVVDAAQLQRVHARADAELTLEPWFAEESGYVVLRPTTMLDPDATLPDGNLPGASWRNQTCACRCMWPPARWLPCTLFPPRSISMEIREQTINLVGHSLSGALLPTDVVSLASVFELRLRSPNTRTCQAELQCA